MKKLSKKVTKETQNVAVEQLKLPLIIELIDKVQVFIPFAFAQLSISINKS